MSVFSSEKEMQEWLEDQFTTIEGLSELIVNIEDIEKYTPKNISEDKIKKVFLYCIESLGMNELLTKNEDISLVKGDSLNPDMFAYAPETESIVIIELKNRGGATREAGTELSAYAGEIKSALSYLSDGEIINVIISPAWPTLLKHHLYNNIFWQSKNTICLEPCIFEDEIKLKIIDIPMLVQADIPIKISEEHLGGYHICLYDMTMYQMPRPVSKLYQKLKLIKSSISAIATKGEKMNTHGFAFLTEGGYLSPYFITLVNVAPFKSIERILHSNDIKSYSDLPLIEKKILDTYLEYVPDGHGASLNTLFKMTNSMLGGVCSPSPELFGSWSELKDHISVDYNPIYFESWGIFKELAIEKLHEKYIDGVQDMDLNSVELGFEVLGEIIDKDYCYIDPCHLWGDFFPKDHFQNEDLEINDGLSDDNFSDDDEF